MAVEITTLLSNYTWRYARLPPRKCPMKCKWVYEIKYKVDGSMERYKARLVAKGCSKVEVEDFTDTFALVAKMSTMRCLLDLATPNSGVFTKWISTMHSCVEIYKKKYIWNLLLASSLRNMDNIVPWKNRCMG